MAPQQRADYHICLMAGADLADSPRPRGRHGLRYVFIVLILILGGVCLWTWLTLSWAYADGIRAGVLQKVVHRGWVCKTLEGTLAQYVVPGISPQIWQFSVRDPEVASQLEKFVGHQVQLHYTEHPGIPSACFADTRFFVDRITVTDNSAVPGPAPAPAVPPPLPAPATSGSTPRQ